MRRSFLLIALTAALASPALGFEFKQLKPLDLEKMDRAALANVYGTWEVRDKTGRRRCRVDFKKDFTIGGYEADVAPGCNKKFPVMADISAWRLSEGWVIDLVDPIRRIRIRLETRDNRYVAFGDPKDIAGIAEFVKIPVKPR